MRDLLFAGDHDTSRQRTHQSQKQPGALWRRRRLIYDPPSTDQHCCIASSNCLIDIFISSIVLIHLQSCYQSNTICYLMTLGSLVFTLSYCRLSSCLHASITTRAFTYCQTPLEHVIIILQMACRSPDLPWFCFAAKWPFMLTRPVVYHLRIWRLALFGLHLQIS